MVASPVAGVQMWFVPIVDPDGFDGAPSGVAFDRNWSDHWGFDNEGSSAADRGPHAASEPEVAALGELLDDVRPTHLLEWQEGDHGRIVYPESWQVADPGDRRARVRGAGRLRRRALRDPRLLARPRRRAGDRQRHADRHRVSQVRHAGVRRAGPGRAASSSPSTSKARDFALDLATDGDAGPDFVPHTFAVSYGQPQTVEVNARRALGAVSVHWRVAGGPEQSEPLSEYKGGERYGAPGAVYHRLRGQVTGFRAGDSVQVWFEGGGETSAAVHVHRRRRPPRRTCSCSPPRTTPARIPVRSTPAPST